MVAQKAGNDVDALVVEAPAQIGFALDVDDSGLTQRGGSSNSHRLAKCVSTNLQNTEAVHLTNTLPGYVDQKRAFFDHFANASLNQIVTLHLGAQRLANVLCTNHDFF